MSAGCCSPLLRSADYKTSSLVGLYSGSDATETTNIWGFCGILGGLDVSKTVNQAMNGSTTLFGGLSITKRLV